MIYREPSAVIRDVAESGLAVFYDYWFEMTEGPNVQRGILKVGFRIYGPYSLCLIHSRGAKT